MDFGSYTPFFTLKFENLNLFSTSYRVNDIQPFPITNISPNRTNFPFLLSLVFKPCKRYAEKCNFSLFTPLLLAQTGYTYVVIFVAQYPGNLIFIHGIESLFDRRLICVTTNSIFRDEPRRKSPMENALYLLYLLPVVRLDRFILHIEKLAMVDEVRAFCLPIARTKRPFASLVYNTIMNFSRTRITFSTHGYRLIEFYKLSLWFLRCCCFYYPLTFFFSLLEYSFRCISTFFLSLYR